MNKKALVLAVAGIVGAPMAAYAQSGNVTIYGRLYPEIGYSKTTGATAVGTPVSTLVSAPTGENLPSLYQVNVSNSRFGLRGQEPLGGGLSAIGWDRGEAARNEETSRIFIWLSRQTIPWPAQSSGASNS